MGTNLTPLWMGTGRKPMRRRRAAGRTSHRRFPAHTAAIIRTAWLHSEAALCRRTPIDIGIAIGIPTPIPISGMHIPIHSATWLMRVA